MGQLRPKRQVPPLVDWADNVTTFTSERRASTDAGLGDRRGEIRAAAPLGCSHDAGRSAVHGGGRPPRHEIRRIGASAWLSCCPREPAGAGAARSRHGLVAIRPPWSNSDVHVVANFCREHEANLSAGDPCLCGAPRRQARTGETPSQPWRHRHCPSVPDSGFVVPRAIFLSTSPPRNPDIGPCTS